MGLQRFTSVESALAMLFGKGVKIAKRDRVSGGDINEAFGLTLTDGRRIFMKANRKENVSFFMAESAGLAAIAAAGAIGTPVVFGFGTDEEGAGSAFLGRLRLVFAGFSHISLLPLGADHGCYMAAELPPSTVGESCAAAEGGPDDSGGGRYQGGFTG